eukprot:TRINITY_DN2439_c0_g1_i6.p1 TRINITY_DN2439_c0_g1~~TRINITY_DN2439_c0_g1_i6.p1  ORF type:complete len:594 (+),score=77.43 TRINITY_DN2439_c0_g1_i6:187-1968(+)
MDRLQRFGTQGPISFSLAPKLFGMQKGRDKEKKGRSKALGRSGVAFDAAGTDPDGLDLIEDPERYTNQVFARDTIEKVKATYESLEKQSERGTVALKQNVYENYPVLISTSRAIAEMEADMLDVRNCLQEFQATVKGLQQTSLVPPKFSEATDVSTSKDSSQRPSATTSSKVLAELSKLMDDLDVLIKIRKYSGAVDLLSSGRKTLKELNASITQAIMNEKTMQLDHMEQVLIEFIAKDLRNPTITKSEMRKFIAFLQKLEQEPMARDLYLKSRSDWIKREVRYIKFSGDILSYASELSRITFAAIASTCKEFTSCFPDKLGFSSFITWAVNEVHDFGASFNRQVFHSDNFGVMARCTEIPKIHCKQLQLLGVDLLPTLEPIFTPSISEAITVFMNNFKSSLSKQMEDEVWLPKDCTIKEDGTKQNALTVKLTDSGRFLVTTTIAFLNDIKPLTSIKLYAPLVSSLVGVIDWYLIKLNEFTLDAMTDQQVMGLLTTVSAILGPCMKRFEDEVVVLFARPVPDFRALSDTHSDLLSKCAHCYMFLSNCVSCLFICLIYTGICYVSSILIRLHRGHTNIICQFPCRNCCRRCIWR